MQQSTAEPVVEKTITFFVARGGRLRKLCNTKHRDVDSLSHCTKPHDVPGGAVWSADVRVSQIKRLIQEIGVAATEYEKEWHEWAVQLKRFNKKTPRVLTAFAVFHAQTVKEHLKAEPVFEFDFKDP